MQVQTTMTVEKFNPETDEVIGEFEVDIFGEFSPEEQGSYWNPPIPARMEFLEALLDNEEYELTREELERAEALLWDAIPEKDSEY